MSEKEAIFKLTRSMIDACESCKDLRTRETAFTRHRKLRVCFKT